MATLPDVCKTPPVATPVPYPNLAFELDLTKGTKTVKADGGNMCANYGSEFSKSTGDEPGVCGGVVSNTFIKEATWIKYSFDVKLEGKGACRLTDKMFHNHQNTVNAAGKFHNEVNLCTTLEKHVCEQKYGEWIKGPKFEFSTWGIDPWNSGDFIFDPPMSGNMYLMFSIYFSGKFVGEVECRCLECGAKRSVSWDSGELSKELRVGIKQNPISLVLPTTKAKMLKDLLMALKLAKGVKGMIKLDQFLQDFGPMILPGIKKVEKILAGAASLVCEGKLTTDKVKAWFDSVFIPIPPDMI